MDSPSAFEGVETAAFRTSRVLPYPPQRLFEAFSRPELLAQWWGPSGFSNTFDLFEFRPGGRWTFTMHGPDGANYANENLFLEVSPPSCLVIKHLSKPHFILTVTLDAHAEGTTIRWVQQFESPAVAASVRHIVEPANEQNLDRLHAVLSGQKP